MRNLKNVRWTVQPVPESDLLLPLQTSAWDPVNNSSICCFGPTEQNQVISLKRTSTDIDSEAAFFQDIATWDALCPLPALRCDQVLSLHYFVDTQSVCLILAGGDLVVVREKPLVGEEKIEIVGSVDAGITAAAWSPDEELLALATRADTLLLMTREFDNVADFAISSEDFKASRQVSVGWGRSETQFKGKRAKALRDPTVPEHIDEGARSKQDQSTATLSWRGDGAYVALSTLSDTRGRVIRVFSREGALDSASEAVDHQEDALGWRPAGNLIASIQRPTSGLRVIFFERNGLRHGEFHLRISEEDALDWAKNVRLQWNIDSTVLAVIFDQRVQLWTMSNCHYFLKQEIFIGDAITDLCWHPEQALVLNITSGTKLHTLQYTSTVDRGSVKPPKDHGAVAVIDGKCLKITHLRLRNIPPPMAWGEIQHKSNIAATAISPDGDRFAILDGTGVTIYTTDIYKKKSPVFTEIQRIDINKAGNSSYMRQIVLADTALYILESEAKETLLHISQTVGTSFSSIETKVISRDGNVTHILIPADVAASKIYYQSANGNVRAQSNSYQSHEFDLKVPVWMQSIEATSIDEVTHIFGLSKSGSLYAGDVLVSKGCTSFLVTSSHLIFTTSQHLIKFVHLSSSGLYDVPPDEPEKDERCRSIERGAKLIVAMPSSFAVVLQMPRGNLETIYPRALVLAGIRRNIESKEFKAAFLACRNHRVDMNIIYDHQPSEFLSRVTTFVQQVQKVEHIDLFLSQLRNEDVTVTMYQNTLPVALQKREDQPPNVTSYKVNRICDAFLATLKDRTSTNLRNLVTAHVCKTPPDLEAGLKMIRSLMEDSPDQTDEAVEHICFLTDVNKLYESALGLYDLDIALLVAQNSQMDPREYLPFLQKVEEMSSSLHRQIFLDDHLKRYSKALSSLHKLNDFDAFKAYTIKHTLFSQALELVKYDPLSSQHAITGPFAAHLLSISSFAQAGMLYESIELYAEASAAYRSDPTLWREALTSALLAPLPEPQLTSLAASLSDTLLEAKDYLAASTIQLEHLSDRPAAARTLCKGMYFADAARLLLLAGPHSSRDDHLASILDAGLRDGLASTTELLAECKAQLGAQVPRIAELRAKKQADPLAYLNITNDASGAAAVDGDDALSLAPSSNMSTSASLFTRYSSASRGSSKSRRREERKRARGKKGSVYEEEYLVASVVRLVERVARAGEEVRRLVEGLLRRGMRAEGRNVAGLMREVVEGLTMGVGKVWDREGEGEVEFEDLDGRIKKVPRPVVKAWGEGLEMLLA